MHIIKRTVLNDDRSPQRAHDEVFYNREPALIEDNGVLVKDPEVVTVSVESIDDKGDSLPVQLLIDGRRLVSTPLSLQDLRGVEHTVQPTTPSEHEFVGWRDGHTTEERSIGWNQSQTLVLEYKREEITVYDVARARLERMMAQGPVEDEEVERLVRSHLEYIRSYVYRFDNRDRAYYEWTYDKVPWLRKKIEKEEIAAIDSIIHQNYANDGG